MDVDEKYMRLALRLARRGMGKTNPNPMVGAVVVSAGKVVGQGYHHRAGEPHAEILALRQAGEKARGGTLYLNLEPCDHFGRTPPCTRAIFAAGIRRVVAGMKDPNPLVSGRGIRRLRRGGIQAEIGILENECGELNAPFRKFMTTGTPWVILKAAATLDGKVAAASGDSRWISSPDSRTYVHRLRSAADAVLVGLGTILRDDPMLNVRVPGVKNPRHPLRVIVDSRLRIPMECRVVRTAEKYPTLVATTGEAPASRVEGLKSAGVTVVPVKSGGDGRVSLKGLMKVLADRGIQSVLLEGGPTLNASAIREKIVDRMFLFIAPKIIGGGNCPGILGGEGCLRVRDAQPWEILNVKRIGPDVMILAGPGDPRGR
jgi:diaminohydroxyphosphoribosylaminopyrimidine deaminase / 5-amino-6-(5-phosphoribosylamino)uracil reductase